MAAVQQGTTPRPFGTLLERTAISTSVPGAIAWAGQDASSQIAVMHAAQMREIGPPASGQASASSTAAGAALPGANSHHASQESNRST